MSAFELRNVRNKRNVRYKRNSTIIAFGLCDKRNNGNNGNKRLWAAR